jgi:1D-myo-inositol-tetrakisphosphate 5-kinase/inositol-polyphosphate multikinase
MIIKPCTQAEIDFYTIASTTPSHAAFYAHMPHFYGSLKASPDQDELQSLLSSAQAQPQAQAQPETEKAPQPDTEGWKPSGGKKLSTGLMLAISNAAAGIQKPCVLDVKLGARLWDDDAPVAKRRKLDEVSEGSTSGSLGFRVAGMKVFDPTLLLHQTLENEGEGEEHCEITKEGYRSYNKFYGRDLSASSVVKAFETFFGGVDGKSGGPGKLKRKNAPLLLKRFIRELESIQFALENEESRMYSASILMVYEGDDEALETALKFEKKESAKDKNEADDGDEENDDDDEDDDAANPKVHEVCLIDFAHAKFIPGAGRDENALKGVRSVLEILRSLA